MKRLEFVLVISEAFRMEGETSLASVERLDLNMSRPDERKLVFYFQLSVMVLALQGWVCG